MTGKEKLLKFAKDALGLAQTVNMGITPLSGRGSDRAFELTWDSTHSAILIHYDPNRIENAYYGSIAVFLRDIGVRPNVDPPRSRAMHHGHGRPREH